MSKQAVDLLQGRAVVVEYKELGLGSKWFRARAPGACAGGCDLASAGLASLPRGVGTSRVVRTHPTEKQGSVRDWGWGQNNGSSLEFFVWRGSWGVSRPAQGMLRAQDVGHPARASGIRREGIPAARSTDPGDAGAGGAR